MAIAIANRYAHALADVVANTGNYQLVLREIQDFAAAYGSSVDLREVLETPALPLPEKMRVIEAVLARLSVSTITRNFLRVLLAHYRMGSLSEVVEAFRRISNERLGIARVNIFSAADLAEADREALRSRFRGLTRKQVELEFHLDPALLGGIRAQIGSTVYDGSVRGHLERLREQLLEGSL